MPESEFHAPVPVGPEGAVAPEGGSVMSSLDELAESAEEFEVHAQARNTRLAFKYVWQSWQRFCQDYDLVPLPANPEHVRAYLSNLAKNGGPRRKSLRARTIEQHLIAITYAHRHEGVAFDAKHPRLMNLMAGIRRKKGVREVGARALRIDDIQAICKALSGFDPYSVRDKAIILLGYAAGWRRSELAALDVRDVQFLQEAITVGGPKVEVVKLWQKRSKTDQEGKGRPVGIVPGQNPETCPVRALKAWIRVAAIEHETDKPLFRPITAGLIEYRRLGSQSIDLILKRAARDAGLEGSFSSHSMRAGNVTEARSRDADRTKVRRQTGHSTDAMLERYDRDLDLFIDNSSGKLGL